MLRVSSQSRFWPWDRIDNNTIHLISCNLHMSQNFLQISLRNMNNLLSSNIHYTNYCFMVDSQLAVYIYCIGIYYGIPALLWALVYTWKRVIFKFPEHSFVHIIENAINMRTGEFNNILLIKIFYELLHFMYKYVATLCTQHGTYS